VKVAFFATCLTDTFFPRVGQAAVRVLRRCGCTVEFPPAQTCCGQPAFNSGFFDHAAALARRMIRIFEPYDAIVSPSASCVSMVRYHFPELLAAEPRWHQQAQRLAERTCEFATFAFGQLGLDPQACLKFAEPVTFHYPCHARGIYDAADLQRWLAANPSNDVRIPQHPDCCCGFGGLFAVEHGPISAAMLEDKLDILLATGARLVICNEAGCALQMLGGARRRGLPLRFKHLAEVMAEELGVLEPVA
jgi:L-lactate dehydrogenase complex protein LldE